MFLSTQLLKDKMSYSLPMKKLFMAPFLSDFEKTKKPKVTFESLPKPKSNFFKKEYENKYMEQNSNRSKVIPSLRPKTKSPQCLPGENEFDFQSMATFNTRLDLPRDTDDYDLQYTPCEDPYDDDEDDYDLRPQTSYLSIPFANRKRALESIAECLTPSTSSASSRGGDVSPDFKFNQILDIKQETFKYNKNNSINTAATWVSKLSPLPKIAEDRQVTPVKVKSVLSLRPNEHLPIIESANQRLENAETFLAHNSRFRSGHSRAESVDSIRTPSTSRHLLWSRGSIMSDGGFTKARSDTNMTKHSFQSEPTPIVADSPETKVIKKKGRKYRRKAATKVFVPYQSFLESVNGIKDRKKSKSFSKSANFTLFFPSINKKCIITPIQKDSKSSKEKGKRPSK